MTGRIRHAVILAAGRGTRMMPLTDELPKAMAPYEESTLIASGIRQIAAHIEHVHVTVGWKGAMLAEHVMHCGTRTVINTDGHTNAWWMYGTLLAELAEPIYVLTCDNVVELDFDLLEADYFRAGEPACMLVPVKPVPRLDGDYLFCEGEVVRRISRVEPSETYASGIQVVNPRAVQALTDGTGDFVHVWDQLIPHSQVRTSRVYPRRWFAVDTVAQLEALALQSRRE